MALLISEGSLILFEFFGNDSPGLGFALLFVGGPLAVMLLLVWFGMFGSALLRGRWRIAASRLTGPLAAVFLCGLAPGCGLPPWRLVFEAMRPYYMLKAFAVAPDAQGVKTLEFTLIDKELWSGHERLTIFYSNPEPATGANATQAVECDGEDRIERTRLGFGFSARHVISSYSAPCNRS